MAAAKGNTKALVSAGRLKADIRLAQAIKDFEKDLPDEQKLQLNNPAVPDSVDVMRLTAQFDRALSLKGVRGFGPRLTAFLEAIQQFASIGDVLIGGSQSLPACGVWTLVRFGLMAMIRIPSNIDNLTTLFMDIGRFAPRYSNLRTMFSRSKDLQVYLMEYHIVVVHLCHKILKLANSQHFKQLFSSFNDTTKKFRAELERWAGAIRDEIAIQMAIQVKSESEESSSFRTMAKHYIKRKQVEDIALLRAKLGTLCCKHDHQKAWIRIRKSGNASFMLQNVEYIKWRDEDSPSTLIFTGILGSGKSVLLANVVEDLHIVNTKYKTTIITYFFCEQNDSNSLEATTIIGSLARQIVTNNTIDDDTFMALQSTTSTNNTSLKIDELCSIILSVIKTGYDIMFVLDGIDNCSRDTKEELFGQLRKFQSSGKFRLCIASRLEPDITSNLRPELVPDSIFVSIPKDNPEIPIFVHGELQSLVQDRKLVVRDQHILEEIEYALITESRGMFLWVALQLSTLCLMESDYEIRQALKGLPKTLNDTYARLLDLAGVHGAQHRKNLLEVLNASLRPLTVTELQEALSIVPGDTKYDPSKIINDVVRILASCKGLVIVDEEDSTVSFVHPSVKQFLSEGDPAIINSSDCSQRMAERILTYVNYSLFETKLVRTGGQQIDLGSAPMVVLDSVLESPKLSKMLHKLTPSRKIDFNRIHATQSRGIDKEQPSYPFLAYVKAYWCNHLRAFRSNNQLCASLLRTALQDGRLDLGEDRTGRTPLIKSVIWNNVDLFTSLLDHTSHSFEDRRHALWTAAYCGSEDVLRVMRSFKTFDTQWRDDRGRSPLHVAAYWDHLTVAKLLLSMNVYMVNDRDGDKQTPLMYAAARESIKVLKLLLQEDAIDVNAVNDVGQTALMYAAEEGLDRPLTILLDDSRVRIWERPASGKGAIEVAAEAGHVSTVQLFLRLSVAGNVKDGGEALSSAARQGHAAVVELILAASVSISFDTINRILCCSRGRETTRLLLVGLGANVNSKDIHGRTPVISAVYSADIEKLRFLIEETEADLRIRDRHSRNALDFARYLLQLEPWLAPRVENGKLVNPHRAADVDEEDFLEEPVYYQRIYREMIKTLEKAMAEST